MILHDTRTLRYIWTSTHEHIYSVYWMLMRIWERDKLQLVIVDGHTQLDWNASSYYQKEEVVRSYRPNLSTIHRIDVGRTLNTGTSTVKGVRLGDLAAPLAYGGGRILVKIDLVEASKFPLDMLQNFKVHNLGLLTGPNTTFYFFIAPRAPKALVDAERHAFQPFIRAAVLEIMRGSQAQFVFVRRPKRGEEASKRKHPMRKAIALEVNGYKTDRMLYGMAWKRAREEIHAITFDDLRSPLSPRVWDEVQTSMVN
jgi:hypothetical protein